MVTSIIGGVQGASAAHSAAAAQQQGYQQAGTTVQNAVNQVNPNIIAAGQTAGQGVTQAAQTGAAGATTAAQQGGAATTAAAQQGSAAATTAAQQGGAAATSAASNLNTMLNPYISGGSAAMNQLSTGLAPGGAFSTPFTASMMAQYSPAYQFQLQQGNLAANRAAAAGGLTGSGGTMKALDRYNQNYAGTAFDTAANLYNTQQQNAFNRLQTVAGMGQTAATTAGAANIGAAEYGGTLGENAAQYGGTLNTGAAEYGGTLGENAAQYGGTLGTQAAQYAGNANINAVNAASQNTLTGANYLANTQIQAQNALAQGDLGAASQWNNMLGGIGTAANTIALGGMGPGGWTMGNLETNIGNMWAGGGGSGYSPNPANSLPGFKWPTIGYNQSTG